MNVNTHPALVGSLSSPNPSVKLINFSPGPASLPKDVEDEIAASFKKPGLTSLALSHRSPEFLNILSHTKASVRRVMDIPDDYELLFTHGGGHGQFAAVPLNLCRDRSDVATYIVNGTWTKRACDEALRYCSVRIIDGRDPQGGYTTFPELTEEKIDPQSKFVYLCSNETVNGIEDHRLPKLPESRRHIPLVIDASSDFTTKPIDWHGDGVGVILPARQKISATPVPRSPSCVRIFLARTRHLPSAPGCLTTPQMRRLTTSGIPPPLSTSKSSVFLWTGSSEKAG